MEIKNIILFVCFGVVILWLIYYGFIRKEDGIVQRVKVYGDNYHLITAVYVKGKKICRWDDKTKHDDEFIITKDYRKKQATTLYNENK